VSRAPKLAETDLGPPVQAWLEANGWTVYREVRYRDPATGNVWIPDLVITRPVPSPVGVFVGVVELKVKFSLDVMAQAWRWRRRAHTIFIAVPCEKKRADAPSEGRALGYEVLKGHGIGVLRVRPWTKHEQRPGAELPPAAARVAVAVKPGDREADASALLAALHEEQKDFSEAGTQSGKRWSATEKAFKAVRELLEGLGGVATIEDVRLAIGFSARVVTRWATEKKIAGVRLDAREEPPVLQLVAPGQEAPITSSRTLKSEWRKHL
jgi:hypothetical protein